MELVPFRHWVVARADDDHVALRFEDRQWSYREHKGIAFAPVATRIFNRCTGEVIFSSPRSVAKVPVEEAA